MVVLGVRAEGTVDIEKVGTGNKKNSKEVGKKGKMIGENDQRWGW